MPIPNRRLTISAVMPAYNEAARIAQSVRGVAPFVDEIIVVDDSSSDGTSAEAQAAGARVFRQPAHQGYIAAIKRGFVEARGDVIVTIDADGEFPAERIPDLVQPIREGRADMVQGRRDRIPRLSERLLNKLAGLRAPVGDTGTGFRAIRADLARRLQLRGACICGVFTLEVICEKGRILDVPIRLKAVNKPRRIAWYHARQFFCLLPWLIRAYPHASESTNEP